MQLTEKQVSEITLMLEENPKYRKRMILKLIETIKETAPSPNWERNSAKSLLACGIEPEEIVQYLTSLQIPLEEIINSLGKTGGHGPNLIETIQILANCSWDYKDIVLALKVNCLKDCTILTSLIRAKVGAWKAIQLVVNQLHHSLSDIVLMLCGDNWTLKEILNVFKEDGKMEFGEISKIFFKASISEKDIAYVLKRAGADIREILSCMRIELEMPLIDLARLANELGFDLKETFNAFYGKDGIDEELESIIPALYAPEGYDASEKALLELIDHETTELKTPEEIQKILDQAINTQELPEEIDDRIIAIIKNE